MAEHALSVLDVYADAVREVIRETAPPELVLRFAESYDEDHQLALARDAEFLLAGWARVPASMIREAKKLRMVHKWGIGIDRIDVDALRAAGIPLAITAGVNAGPVAEHTLMLMLAVLRRLPYADRSLRDGRWVKAEMRSTAMQLTGKTVGIVGFGNIGRLVARKLAGFECRILYYDPRPADEETERAFKATYRPLERIYAESDIVSLHLPATPETTGMIDAAAIARMKRGAVLINTARGELVDETALYEALRTGHLLGAGLDSFVDEPPAPDNPLLGLDNTAVTPHTGGAAFDNVANTARHAFANITRFLEGRPLPQPDVIVPPPAN